MLAHSALGPLDRLRTNQDRAVSPTEPVIRNVSDTARWAAVYRSQKSLGPLTR
jgi:hypothetical protein